MKKTFFSTLLAVSLVSLAYAGEKIEISAIPEPVNKIIAEYFPESKTLSAEKDTERGKVQYEVKIQYKDIHLEVEVSAEGKILDVDQKK